MKKNDLVASIAKQTKLTQSQVSNVIDCSIKTIVSTCRDNDEEVNLQGFGKFVVKDTKEHIGINPATCEKIQIKGSKSIRFVTSPAIKVVK